MGVSIGVVAALLFGTEEGRKIVKSAFDAIPDKYKQILGTPLPPIPIITPEETPHHATFDLEAPPPPPPVIHPHHPS